MSYDPESVYTDLMEHYEVHVVRVPRSPNTDQIAQKVYSYEKMV